MYISKVETKNFRNLPEFAIELRPDVTVLVGENNVGKTNLQDALRLILGSASMPKELWAKSDDIYHDPNGVRGEFFEIHVTISGIEGAELAWFAGCLCPQLGDGIAQLHYRFEVVQNARGQSTPKVHTWGGETEGGRIEADLLASIRLIYLDALRDAKADLRPGKRTRLGKLLTQLSESEVERDALVHLILEANQLIGDHPLVIRTSEAINEKLREMTGHLWDHSATLALSDPSFQKIVDSFRAQTGNIVPLEISENGLGVNNILYAATVLSELRDAQDADLRLLMVEEPEAHLHPQLQMVFVDSLLNVSSDKATVDQDEEEKRTDDAGTPIQTILTTHSPTIACHVPVEKLCVLHNNHKNQLQAVHIANCGLNETEALALSRFLDATKANLFFARGVILVEGIAEALLVPQLAKYVLGEPHSSQDVLSKYGVSVVNVNGLSFEPFAKLFGPTKLDIRCSLITDGDPTLTKEELADRSDGTMSDADANEILYPESAATARKSRTAQKLLKLSNANVQTFLATKTFEYDLCLQGNHVAMIKAYAALKPKRAQKMMTEAREMSSAKDRATSFYVSMDQKQKGRFAQQLQILLETKHLKFYVPTYLANAIRFAARLPLPMEVTHEPTRTDRVISKRSNAGI